MARTYRRRVSDSLVPAPTRRGSLATWGSLCRATTRVPEPSGDGTIGTECRRAGRCLRLIGTAM
eukprot:6706127-Alexandrium_andersonii.AAC.1